jgi:hypothetical protein
VFAASDSENAAPNQGEIMNTIEIPTAPTAPMSVAPAERVLDTLLLVARRADALARRQQQTGRETDRRVWLRAELEVFEAGNQPRRDVSVHAA